MKRRTAIGLLGGVASGPLLMPISDMLAWAEQVRASAAPVTGGDASDQVASLLTPARAQVMEALAQVIIPETDTPGAGEAGVVDFVAALVDGWLDEEDRDRFLSGLDTVDPEATRRFGAVFSECAADQQAALVGDLDGEVARLRDDPSEDETRHFFHEVKRFTLTAYFTSRAGLETIGWRTSFRTFEGCAPLTSAGVNE